MTQNFPLDEEQIVHEGFFDAIQELLGAAAPSLRIVVLNATTLQVAAAADNGQQTIAVNGRYRWRTTNTTAALPGGIADGTHPVFVTGSDNDYTGPEEDPDQPTDYSFGLGIFAAGNTPSTELYRQVGEVDVASGAITAFRQTVGQRNRAGDPLWATADHPSQVPIVGRGASGQTAELLRLETSAGVRKFSVDKDGLLSADTVPTAAIRGKAVTGAKIADGAVGNDQLSGAIAFAKLAGLPIFTSVSSGAVSGTGKLPGLSITPGTGKYLCLAFGQLYYDSTSNGASRINITVNDSSTIPGPYASVSGVNSFANLVAFGVATVANAAWKLEVYAEAAGSTNDTFSVVLWAIKIEN